MSEATRLVEQTADRLFAAESGPARDALARGDWPRRLWDAFDEAGLGRALLVDNAGGAGFEAGLAVLRAAGRHAAPIPVAETLVGTLLCAAAGVETPVGPLAVASAPPPGRAESAEEAEAGTLFRVPWARFAAAVAVVLPGRNFVLIEPSGVSEGVNLAGEPRDDVTFAAPRPAASGLPDGIDGGGLMAVARAAQLRGAMERVLAMSLRHAGERVQFGRPLARFQAIQHHLAVLAGEVAASGAAVDAAAGAETGFAFAAAKARTSQAAGVVARLAHQVHGAIGFTEEHPLHHWTKRLWSWRDECGSEACWWAVLGEHVARRGSAALWPAVVAAGSGEEGHR